MGHRADPAVVVVVVLRWEFFASAENQTLIIWLSGP
jgi:hypothetical protein